MELEEMKKMWTEFSEQLAQQQRITKDIVLQMTHERSSSRLNNIVVAEKTGVVITLGMLVYLLYKFPMLTGWLSITGGVFTALILFVSLILGLRIILLAGRINVSQNSVRQTLEDFGALRKQLHIYKRISIPVYILMPFFLIPVVTQIMHDKTLTIDSSQFWYGVGASAIIMPIAWYLIYLFYSRNIRKVKALFKDLEVED